MQRFRSNSRNNSAVHRCGDFRETLRRNATLIAAVGVATLGSAVSLAAVTGAQAASVSPKPTANASAAFCRQIKASQAVIAKAAGTPAVKLGSIGAEWTKIAATAPADVKADVLIVRTAYAEAAKAGVDTAAKTPAVATAGAKISSYFAQNCGGGGIGDAAGGGGDDGPGRGGPGGDGPDSAERSAYRECLTKNGLSLPAQGQGGPSGPAGGLAGAANGGSKDPAAKPAAAKGAASVPAKPAVGANPASGAAKGPQDGGQRRGGFGLDPSDPAVAKAMKACESLRPAGGFGGGRGGFANPALQACLTKKGVTLAPPTGAGGSGGAGAAGGANAPGGAGGARPTLDAKTQAAFAACQKELGTNG
jgi:hypothetical protein